MHEISTFEDLGAAERLALAYARGPVRGRFAAFLMLDAQLRGIAAAGREPMLTQVRLAWWRDALASPAAPAANAHPVLAAATSAFGQDRTRLAVLVDGWEGMGVGERGAAALAGLAQARAEVCQSIASAAPPAAVRSHCAIWTAMDARAFPGFSASTDTARTRPLPALPRDLRPLVVLSGLARRSLAREGQGLLDDRLSPLAAIRLGIFGH